MHSGFRRRQFEELRQLGRVLTGPDVLEQWMRERESRPMDDDTDRLWRDRSPVETNGTGRGNLAELVPAGDACRGQRRGPEHRVDVGATACVVLVECLEEQSDELNRIRPSRRVTGVGPLAGQHHLAAEVPACCPADVQPGRLADDGAICRQRRTERFASSLGGFLVGCNRQRQLSTLVVDGCGQEALEHGGQRALRIPGPTARMHRRRARRAGVGKSCRGGC